LRERRTESGGKKAGKEDKRKGVREDYKALEEERTFSTHLHYHEDKDQQELFVYY